MAPFAHSAPKTSNPKMPTTTQRSEAPRAALQRFERALVFLGHPALLSTLDPRRRIASI
jgi:hypothetical protein